jgi:murein DD-endopeptidase MepM/ murein hydrolase activator NlpD
MIKKILYTLILSSYLMGSYSISEKWAKNETVLSYLKKNGIPLLAYHELPSKEKEVMGEISVGVECYKLTDETSGKLLQALIPLNTGELQVHIFLDDNNSYKIKLTPVAYEKHEKSLHIVVKDSLYRDLIEISGSRVLPIELSKVYKSRINFKREIKKNDGVSLVYYEKTRLGKKFGSPVITTANIKLRSTNNYIFLNEDGSYYDEQGKQVDNLSMIRPVSYKRISSGFSKKRWHPVLKRYRAHLGIDYAAKRGTSVKAATDGYISFVGRKGGYGKTVEIKHSEGYKTLYAHLSRYGASAKTGKRVKKGTTVGYVGSTGLSTGPHLHFGLYKYSKPINPNRIIKITSSILKGDKKDMFLKLVATYKNKLNNITPIYFALTKSTKENNI